MSLSIAAVAATARTLWRRERTLLAPLTGLLVFVPQWALLMLVPPLPGAAQAGGGFNDAWLAAMSGWINRYGGWYVLATVLGHLATMVVSVLILHPGRPTLGGALRRGAVAVWRYLLALLVIQMPLAALALALMPTGPGVLLIVPVSLTVLARCALTAPVLAAEAPVGAVAAVVRSWRLTRGATGPMLALIAGPMLAGFVAGSIPTAFVGALTLRHLGNPVAVALLTALSAAAAWLAALAVMLVGVAAYARTASPPR